jgi:FkbM family methyltransferase
MSLKRHLALETVLQPIGHSIKPLLYVACGARGSDTVSLVELLPNARYVGFEPDHEECRRLNANARDRYTFVPEAVGKCVENRTLHVTRYPSCSSLLPPNPSFFGRFAGCASAVTVERTLNLKTISLAEYLTDKGFGEPHFLELDTQGSELDILQGAEDFLVNSVAGLKIEVEFAPVYLNQPLFAQVDSYLRSLGFMLFDLSRNRYRRENYPAYYSTRGQLVWGDALYLRNHECLKRHAYRENALRLFLVAAFLGFHDYALEVLSSTIKAAGSSSKDCSLEIMKSAKAGYLTWLANQNRVTWWMRCLRAIAHSRMRWSLQRASGACRRITSATQAALKSPNESSWVD